MNVRKMGRFNLLASCKDVEKRRHKLVRTSAGRTACAVSACESFASLAPFAETLSSPFLAWQMEAEGTSHGTATSLFEHLKERVRKQSGPGQKAHRMAFSWLHP